MYTMASGLVLNTAPRCTWILSPLYQNPIRVAWHRRYRVPRPCSHTARTARHARIEAWSKRRDDPPAPKYCFMAKCTIHSDHEPGGAVGVVFAFDKRPDVSKHVDGVASQFAKDTGMIVTGSDLTVFQECPQEVSDHVYVQLFEAPMTEDEIQKMIAATIQENGCDSCDESDDEDPPGGGGGGGGSPGPSGGGGRPGGDGPNGPSGDGPGGVIKTSFPKQNGPKGPVGQELALP